MKTFEQEYLQLVAWMKMKNKEYDEAIDKDTTGGRDGELVYQRAQDVKEYNRRLTELKKKYGKEPQTSSAIMQETDLFAKAERVSV